VSDPEQARRNAPTLRGAWLGTIVKLLCVIAGLDGVAFVATQYQQTVFDRTLNRLDAEQAALVAIDDAQLQIYAAATGFLWGLGGTEAREGHRAAYEEARQHTYQAFTDAAPAMSSDESRTLLAQANESWVTMDAGVMAGAKLWSSSGLDEAIAAKADPFASTVWTHQATMNQRLSDLGTRSVADLRRSTAGLDRTQELTLDAVVATLVLALVLAWLASRRMSREVVDPLVDLRRSALAMRGTEHVAELTFGGAVVEVQDLAESLNATARSLRISHERLSRQANTDALTGLPNRKALLEQLEELLGSPSPTRLSILFVDLDDFKIVNDMRGHAAGDELLRVVANRLRADDRDEEIVARLGGDEFANVLQSPVHTPESPAIAVAHRIIAALAKPVTIDGTLVSIGCSIGIALVEPGVGAESIDELLRQADLAMYVAKGRGKNSFEVYDAAFDANAVLTTN
jgi:diguanylate cyclase (GGDEF)-like protein